MNNPLLNNKSSMRELLEIFLTAFCIYTIISLFFIVSNVNQTSMTPNFKDGDLVLATKSYLSNNEFERGDVVLLKSDGIILIKRIIGLPNEEIKIESGKVYINDVVLDEPYLQDDIRTRASVENENITVENDSYYVLGDNRNNSIDSRTFGNVHSSQIIGEVIMKLVPQFEILK